MIGTTYWDYVQEYLPVHRLGRGCLINRDTESLVEFLGQETQAIAGAPAGGGAGG